MSEKEELLKCIATCSPDADFEDIIIGYINTHEEDFPAKRVDCLCKRIGNILTYKINQIDHDKMAIRERATYLSMYLQGNMYSNREAAEKHVGIQIGHAKKIIDLCSGCDE